MPKKETDNPFARREAAIQAIRDRNEIEHLDSLARGGDGKAILKRFQMAPEHGGYADIVADKDILEETHHRAAELLESGAPNNWHTYSQAAQEMRQKYQTLGAPPPELIQMAERHADTAEAIHEMRQNRLAR